MSLGNRKEVRRDIWRGKNERQEEVRRLNGQKGGAGREKRKGENKAEKK